MTECIVFMLFSPLIVLNNRCLAGPCEQVSWSDVAISWPVSAAAVGTMTSRWRHDSSWFPTTWAAWRHSASTKMTSASVYSWSAPGLR